MNGDLANPGKESFESNKGLVERILIVDWSTWIVRAIILFSFSFGSFLMAAGNFVSGASFFGVSVISYYLLERSLK